jgi:hypothetical protein
LRCRSTPAFAAGFTADGLHCFQREFHPKPGIALLLQPADAADFDGTVFQIIE